MGINGWQIELKREVAFPAEVQRGRGKRAVVHRQGEGAKKRKKESEASRDRSRKNN